MTAAVLLMAMQVAAPGSLCTLCHPDVRVQFEASVHRLEGLACADCHGGDPKAATVEAAHRGAFRRLDRRREIPAHCATCHSDVARMRPYNLPVDQYALYQTSGHGVRLARGDERVAVCTDCHGVHDIRRKDDPASRVFPHNIPATCGGCHGAGGVANGGGDGRKAAGAAAGEPAAGDTATRDDPVTAYRSGVHGRAFLEVGNASAPQCASCHGAHGAAPPGVGDVDKVCGQCHATARAYFLDGPHATALRDTGVPECASCHGNHAVGPAGIGLLDGACRDCHADGSPQAVVAETMKTLYTNASEEIDRAGALVARAAAVPLYVEDYRARLQEAGSAMTEAYPVMHALDVSRVETLTRRARSIASEVESEVEGKLLERRWNRVGLLLFWFYLLLTVAILVRFRRRAAGTAAR